MPAPEALRERSAAMIWLAGLAGGAVVMAMICMVIRAACRWDDGGDLDEEDDL
jgi:hypothetical protein